MELQDSFIETITSIWGEQGEAWLERLPNIVQECERRFKLVAGEPVSELSVNYVCNAEFGADKQPSILKIGVNISRELTALDIFAGTSCVEVLAAEPDLNAMVLEKISPGTPLTQIQRKDDEEATRIAAPLIRDLPRRIPEGQTFKDITESWEPDYANSDQPEGFPFDMVERAKELIKKLEDTCKQKCIIHGDLHHDNILYDDKRGWIVIDPIGFTGDPVANAARFLLNPITTFERQEIPEALLNKRVEMLAEETSFEPFRIAGWGYADCMAFACWTNQPWLKEHLIRCARVLVERWID